MLVVTLTELLDILKHFWGKIKTIVLVLILAGLMMWNCAMPFGGTEHQAFLETYNVQQTFIKLCQTAIVFLAPFFILWAFIRWLFTPGD